MPIYEYRCTECREKSGFLTKSVHITPEAVCKYCGSDKVERIISLVSFRSSQALQTLSPSDDYYSNPDNIGKHTEESCKRYGVEMPESLQKTIQKARKGHIPYGIDL